MSERIIFQLQDLKKFFGQREVLKGITLSFLEGAKIGVIGPNGAGKSTLLRIMSGLDTKFEGVAKPLAGITVGYLQQEPPLNEEKDVIGNLEEAVEPIHEIVTGYEAYAGSPTDARCLAGFHEGLGTPFRVHSTRVRDDANTALHAGGEDPLHKRYEVPSKTGLGITRALLLHDRHRDLSQIVEHEVVDRTAFDLTDRCLEIIPPKALTARNPNNSLVTQRAPPGIWNAPMCGPLL